MLATCWHVRKCLQTLDWLHIPLYNMLRKSLCNWSRVQVRLARLRMIRLHTPAVCQKTWGPYRRWKRLSRGTQRASSEGETRSCGDASTRRTLYWSCMHEKGRVGRADLKPTMASSCDCSVKWIQGLLFLCEHCEVRMKQIWNMIANMITEHLSFQRYKRRKFGTWGTVEMATKNRRNPRKFKQLNAHTDFRIDEISIPTRHYNTE